ncbi:MAG: M42 family metallopeptidase [Caldisericaceae bacterium]
MANIDLIQRLSNAVGVSGDEREVSNILREEIKGYVESLSVDSLGNLIALKGLDKPGPKVLINAHMDEVGFVVVRIDEKGFLYFKAVGGVDARLFFGKRVIISENKVPGVIGAKAIHLQNKEEVKQSVPVDSLYIDIGAADQKEAEKLVPLGSLGTFDTQFEKIAEGKYTGKAFDDRLGCAIVAELLRENFKFPIIALFSSQEEIGLRGAGVGAYKYTPDISVTIEGTISADLPEVKEHLKCSKLGEGPVVTVKDKAVITDNELRTKLLAVAKQKNIAYQFKQVIAGGTDSARIQLTKGGVKVLVVAVPVRYIHSPVALFYESDYENTKKLVFEFLNSLQGGKNE